MASDSAAALQVGHDRAQQDGTADRGEGILGSHQNCRRRPAADALKGGQNLGQHVAPLGRARRADAVLVGQQRAQPLLGAVARRLKLLDLLAGVDQRLVERGAVLVERVDLALEFGLALVGHRDVAGDRFEFGLAGSRDRLAPGTVSAAAATVKPAASAHTAIDMARPGFIANRGVPVFRST